MWDIYQPENYAFRDMLKGFSFKWESISAHLRWDGWSHQCVLYLDKICTSILMQWDLNVRNSSQFPVLNVIIVLNFLHDFL